MDSFSGVKAALLIGNQIIAIQRDVKPRLCFSGMWDLSGGGREGDETSFATAAREIREELGITLYEQNVQWVKSYPSLKDPQQTSYFIVITITNSDIDSIQFGGEGIGWRLYTIRGFMKSDEIIPGLKHRLGDYLTIGQM